MEGSLQTLWIATVLRCSDGRMSGGNLEYYRGFLISKRSLCRELVREGIMPRKVDPNLRKPQLEQLELAEIFVQ